jgi:radical SAM protein with 4Fe4S-binding SPASM domain
MTQFAPHLKRVYWESTAGCNLRCIHCRRLDILDKPDPYELSTLEAKALIDEVASFGRPVFIFSGGEPLVRHDLFELAAYAKGKSLPIALATNGTLIDADVAKRLKEAGIYYASVSFDGAKAETHNLFRGTGAFEKTLIGMRLMQEAGIKVQINFTVTRMNVREIQAVYDLARENRAIALYLFLLVPVGCGVQIANEQMLSSEEVEAWLNWVAEKDHEGPLPLKAICAPQYFRIEHDNFGRPEEPISADRKGCLAGLHMCFVTHKGDVYPCGYLPLAAGNVRNQPFRDIWNNSSLFRNLRDSSLLSGRCGACDFKDVCGGCRARGFSAHGNVLAEEPYCVYTPEIPAAKSAAL